MIHHALPDIMYFGSPQLISVLNGRVFLTSHIGIASLFIIDKQDLFPRRYSVDCNMSYRQWSCPNNLLSEPLKTANLLHNIVTFENTIFEGQSSGYIHFVDISNVKGRLSLFVTNDPDREVIYNGGEPLTIIKAIRHTIQWDVRFSPEEVRKYGVGTVEKRD